MVGVLRILRNDYNESSIKDVFTVKKILNVKNNITNMF